MGVFVVFLVEVHQLAAIMLLLLIRRCAGDGSLIFLLCRPLRSCCTLSANYFLSLKGWVP